MDAGLEHRPSEQNKREAKLLLSFGHTDESVAAHLDITLPTFKKHYDAQRKEAKHFLELRAGATCVQNLDDENASVRQKAAEFILARKCKWSDKTISDEAKNAIFDSIVQQAAQEMLAKKEQENEY